MHENLDALDRRVAGAGDKGKEQKFMRVQLKRAMLPLRVDQVRSINLALAATHAILAVACFAPDALVVDVATAYPVWNESCEQATRLCMQLDYVDDRNVFIESVSVNALCFWFFAVTSAAHVYYARNAATYISLVEERQMWWRWVEYAVSVPPMVIIISVLNGLTLDLPLVQGAALGSVTQYFGYASEQVARNQSEQKRALGVHLLGYPLVFLALGPVVISLQDIAEAPSFVPFLIGSQVVLFTAFGAVQLWTLCGPPERYATGDAVYLALSLVCKATLGGSFIAATAALS